MAGLTYPLFLICGLAPSFIWLTYYLHKDRHPEPKQMVTRIFFWGMLSTIPALFFELIFKEFFSRLPVSESIGFILYIFIGIALVEEIFKFLVVRAFIYSNSAMDEPLDLMLYMVVSSLGFAAFENILILVGLGGQTLVSSIVGLSILRFLGATFLHTLSSAILGYFLALSYGTTKNRVLNLIKAFTFATLLHGAFNFYILKAEGIERIFIPLFIFIITAFFISVAFSKLRKMKSICSIA